METALFIDPPLWDVRKAFVLIVHAQQCLNTQQKNSMVYFSPSVDAPLYLVVGGSAFVPVNKHVRSDTGPTPCPAGQDEQPGKASHL